MDKSIQFGLYGLGIAVLISLVSLFPIFLYIFAIPHKILICGLINCAEINHWSFFTIFSLVNFILFFVIGFLVGKIKSKN